MSNDSENIFNCCACGDPTLEELDGFRSLRRVTSDCRPWPANGRLGVCATCGCAQSIADAAFIREIDAIYEGYAIYHQSAGAEQRAFDAATGDSSPRSEQLLKRFLQRFPLPPKGRLLDVGCGNGSTLKAFGKFLPGWSLAGTELNEKYRRSVEAITGEGGFYACSAGSIPGEFDVISMVHVLEHVVEPVEFLREIRSKLTAGGRLLIEVPGYRQNPFELLIADHRTHFDPASLAALVKRAGFSVELSAEDWVAKELTLVAGFGNDAANQAAPPAIGASGNRALLSSKIRWLRQIADDARNLAHGGQLGIFGTSIAATWLAAELEGAAAFFVDEDRSRTGRRFMDRAVLHPADVPEGAVVYMTLPPPLAEAVARRLHRPEVNWHLPPSEPLPSVVGMRELK